MREVVEIVLIVVFTAFVAIFVIGAVIVNLFDREHEVVQVKIQREIKNLIKKERTK